MTLVQAAFTLRKGLLRAGLETPSQRMAAIVLEMFIEGDETIEKLKADMAAMAEANPGESRWSYALQVLREAETVAAAS